MIVSLGEIEAATLKATRGAGYGWGLAEEAGKAARWLAARRLPCLEVLVPLLESHRAATACPLAIGTGLADLPHESSASPRRIDRVSAPILLLPFVADIAKTSARSLDIRWPEVVVRFDRAGEIVDIDAGAARLACPVAKVMLTPGEGGASGRCPARLGGVAVDAGLWSRLDDLVILTYVPESEESRRRGAGAVALERD